MKTYEKDGVIYEVFCDCDTPKGVLPHYPREGEWDSCCPSCGYYYHYYPSLPLVSDPVTEDCDNDTVEDEDEETEEETLTCDECGEECYATTETEEGGVCASCLHDKFIFCKECSSWQYSENSHRYGSGHLCEDCYDNNYSTCDRCGEIHHCNDTVKVTVSSYQDFTEYWCDDCAGDYAYKCDDCGELFAEGSTCRDDNHTYCHSCMENYTTCDDCGVIVHQEHSYYREDDDCTYCEYCYSDKERNNKGKIRDYNFKPYAAFHGKGPLYLGVELEMECRNRSDTAGALHELSDYEDLFYIKSDGSLNNGIELVTHPCSLAYHQEEFGWSDILKKAVSQGARSHDTSTCGIHVHLSRKFFTLSEITRFVAFVNVHGDHLKRLARRGASDYSRFKDKKNGTRKLVNQEARYEAVNLYNSNTLEVRIFKGTLKESTLMSCIEICDAMARFVKTSNIASIIGKSEKNWEQFLNYVQNNLKVYSYLYAYMQGKGMIQVLPPAPVVYLADPPAEVKLEDAIFGTPEIVPEPRFPWEFTVEPNSGIYAA